MIIQQENRPSAPEVVAKPRERGLGGIDTRPVEHRLHGGIGKPWSHVLGKINKLKGMRYPATRAAYLRCVGEQVAPSEGALPGAEFYVDENGNLARRDPAKDDRPSETVVLSTEIEAFLDRRSIGKRGQTLFWFEPTARYSDAERTRFRQGRALNEEESAIFADLDEADRVEILSRDPARSPAPAN